MEWTTEKVKELRERWAVDPSTTRIARAMGVTRNTIIGKSRRLSLQYHSKRPLARSLNPNHRAVIAARSVFSKSVRNKPFDVFKPGSYQRKLGGVITKGDRRGWPIFSLTLEERATCPVSCKQWLSCYGNAMHNAGRFAHGPELEIVIWRELATLQAMHPRGFVVRLHILGDFYSIEYVDLWRQALDAYPALHVFGYSARLKHTPIGDALIDLRTDYWDRFAVRTSGGHWQHGPHTIVVRAKSYVTKSRGRNTILCPAQTGQTASCSTCALCWSAPDKTIAFLRH